MRFKDYYKVLGVEERASQEDIKKSYRNLAKRCHPDANPGNKVAEDRFKELNEAYDILSNVEKRNKYDQLRFYGRADTRNEEWITFDPEFLRNHGWPGTQGHRGDSSYRYMGQGFAFSDLLRDIFGVNGFTTGYEPPQTVSADITGIIRVGLTEAITGTEKTIVIRQKKRCANCAGTGQDRYAPCMRCNGSGQIASKKKIRIRIPPGVEDNHQLRLRGLGQEPGFGNGKPGDVIITVKVKSHPFFKRSGADIYCEARVEPHLLQRGTRVRVPTADGGQVELNIPAGTRKGTVFRLKNRGMRMTSRRGDQYIKIV